jgi:hypothetical protein
MKDRAPVVVGPPDRQVVVMWERASPLGSVPELYRHPPRPPVVFTD